MAVTDPAVTYTQGGATISRGVEWNDDLRHVDPALWPDLVDEYRWFCRRNLSSDCRSLLRMISEGEHVGWAGYGDRERYIREGLGLDPEAVDWALAGLRLTGAEVPVGFQQAQTIGERAAMMAGPDGVTALAKHGRPTKDDAGKGSVATFSDVGRGAAYLVARLKRDAPGFAERLAAGEFPSARAAALAAGIVKPAPNPLEQLRRAWKLASAEQKATFLAEAAS